MSDQANSTSQNSIVREYIQYYVKLKDPGYAVLLSGPWGSGKTWFIEDTLKQIYKEDNKAAKNYLFVSLYGMTNFSDIENEFFRQLHPVLSSKPAQFAGRLLKGIVKLSVNIDVDGDGKSDGALSGGIPNESLFGGTGEDNNKLVIFDDVERCSIKLTDLLGYINQLVEKGGFRTILIGNEEEMTKLPAASVGEVSSSSGGPDPLYLRIKEKLIGQTFQVEPEIGNAFSKFCDELPDEAGKQIVTQNASLAQEIYLAAQFNNLRGLRHSLMEFNRMCRGIDKMYLNHEKLMADLLAEFLCYSLIVRSGKLPAEKIGLVRTTIQIGPKQNTLSDEQLNIESWLFRMPWIAGFTPLLEKDVWKQIFAEGEIPSNSINLYLGSSKHFQSEATPKWIQLWHGTDLPDADFKLLLSTVLNEWDERQYTHEGPVLHVMGMLLEYGRDGLHHRSSKSILRQGKRSIKQLSNSGKIVPARDPFRLITGSGYAGLGYMGQEFSEFKELKNFLNKELQVIEKRSLPSLARMLMMKLDEGAQAFYSEITQNQQRGMSGALQPLFKSIDAKSFSKKISNMGGTGMYFVAGAIKSRFESSRDCVELLDELKFLEVTNSALNAHADRQKGHMSSRNIRLHLLPAFENAINNLKSAASSEGHSNVSTAP